MITILQKRHENGIENKKVRILEFCFLFWPSFAWVYLENHKRYRISTRSSRLNKLKEKKNHIKIESDNGCQVPGELKI